jgi:hypothetical protein
MTKNKEKSERVYMPIETDEVLETAAQSAGYINWQEWADNDIDAALEALDLLVSGEVVDDKKD